MSSELRLKKLRGSGGYVMARVTDQQQMKGNLGGPDLFLAPIGRIDSENISKHFCNTCEKEFEDSPKIVFESPNEEVAENLVLVERGQYLCNSCNSTIAEYRDFKKSDEAQEVGAAKPIQTEIVQEVAVQREQVTQIEQPVQEQTPEVSTETNPVDSTINSIAGMTVYDENAKKIGNAKQVGVDSSQTVVLIITKDDGTDVTIPWNKIKTVGEVILLGNPDANAQTPTDTSSFSASGCGNCGFVNKNDAKFCEECGSKIQPN